MKAVRITDQGGPEVLKIEDVPDPVPGPTELLVDVRAAALNRADLLQAMGMYPAPPDAPQDIPGLEYAGEVRAVGARVRRFKVGDRVMGIVGGGAFAQQIVTHEREAIAVPANLDFAKAAAIPEAFFTAFDALVLQGEMRASENVLVHAAASGVGTAGVQLAAALGANVFGTSRSADKLERCKSELGLHTAIAVTDDPPSFADRVNAATGKRGVDLVLDLVGGSYLPETARAAAYRGRIILVGLLAGPSAELPLGMLLSKRLRVFGTTLRSRPLEEKIAVAQAFERQLLPMFATGRLKPVVDKVFPMQEIQQAALRMAENASFGKVVLQWS